MKKPPTAAAGGGYENDLLQLYLILQTPQARLMAYYDEHAETEPYDPRSRRPRLL